MRKIQYHSIRIIPLLLLTALVVWRFSQKWDDGQQIRTVIHGLTALATAITFGIWLYSGHFQFMSFSAYLRRYSQWRFFKRDILPFIVFSLIGTACAVGIFAIFEPKTLRAPLFYVMIVGVIFVTGLIEAIVGYIKYCYSHD